MGLGFRMEWKTEPNSRRLCWKYRENSTISGLAVADEAPLWDALVAEQQRAAALEQRLAEVEAERDRLKEVTFTTSGTVIHFPEARGGKRK